MIDEMTLLSSGHYALPMLKRLHCSAVWRQEPSRDACGKVGGLASQPVHGAEVRSLKVFEADVCLHLVYADAYGGSIELRESQRSSLEACSYLVRERPCLCAPSTK